MNRQMLLKIADACDDFLAKAAMRDPDWKRFHRIADGAAPGMRDAFLKAIAKLQGDIALKKVENALAQGDVQAAIDAINWPLFEGELSTALIVPLHSVARKSSQVALNSIPVPEMRINYSFDLLNNRALEWAQKHAGELITQIGDDTKQGVRAIITDAFENGGHPYVTARDIKQLVGLTDKQALAVVHQTQKMRDAGVNEQQIAQASKAYADRLHLYRAETIARNETINASKEGQWLLWQDAVQQGYLDPDEWEMVWITTDDDRTCPDCLDMDKKTAPLDGDFDTIFGPMKIAHLHVQCRCASALQHKKDIEKFNTNHDSKGRFASGSGHDIHVKKAISLYNSSGHIKEGSKITGVKVIANGDKIREVDRLVRDHPLSDGRKSDRNDWQKMRGTAIIISKDASAEGKSEVHWYQCKNVGKVEFKIKSYPTGDKNENDG